MFLLSKRDTDAIRFYEDAGFTGVRHVSVHLNHNIMELSRAQFDELYKR